MMTKGWGRTLRVWSGAWVCAVAVAACGGGGGGESSARASQLGGQCTVPEQIRQVRAYMQEAYYFNDQTPQPDPAAFNNVQSFFYASLYTVDDRSVASDHWSFLSDTASFDTYFEDGRELGYGLITASPGQVSDGGLVIRSVDPASPAYRAGLRRGQTILKVNGRVASTLTRKEYGDALYPFQPGQRLYLDVSMGGQVVPIEVAAGSYEMTLLRPSTVLASASGKRAGYIRLDGFVDKAGPELSRVLNGFAAAPVDALMLDLRYDSGGSLDLAMWLVNEIVGQGHEGQVMAKVKYSRLLSKYDQDVLFHTSGLKGWKTVYVLSGPDTCSASEFVINTLKPFVNVVQIGSTSCGKPFGFQPAELRSPCQGTLLNAVNFEVFNRDGGGRYYAGLTPTCDVADDVTRETGDPLESVTAAALSHMDTGTCPGSASTRMFPQSVSRAITVERVSRGVREGMWRR